MQYVPMAPNAGTSLRRAPRWRRATPCWPRWLSWRSTCRRRPARRCCGAPRSCSSTRATCTARPQVSEGAPCMLVPEGRWSAHQRRLCPQYRCHASQTRPTATLCSLETRAGCLGCNCSMHCSYKVAVELASTVCVSRQARPCKSCQPPTCAHGQGAESLHHA